MDNNTIMKTSNISFDLGAIAKGYVTELVGDYLDSIGIHKYLITAGTSSVKAGDHYNNSRYKIGLTDPINPDNLYKVINGNNIAITTSGSFERYYEYEGVKYSHIIDPHTLSPQNYMLSVTVITDDAALGEILSTTLFLMPIKDGLNYIKQFDEVEAIWYGMDGNITMSDGMKKYE
jgi:thiamine biosynthesis lipoprotein